MVGESKALKPLRAPANQQRPCGSNGLMFSKVLIAYEMNDGIVAAFQIMPTLSFYLFKVTIGFCFNLFVNVI